MPNAECRMPKRIPDPGSGIQDPISAFGIRHSLLTAKSEKGFTFVEKVEGTMDVKDLDTSKVKK